MHWRYAFVIFKQTLYIIIHISLLLASVCGFDSLIASHTYVLRDYNIFKFQLIWTNFIWLSLFLQFQSNNKYSKSI